MAQPLHSPHASPPQARSVTPKWAVATIRYLAGQSTPLPLPRTLRPAQGCQERFTCRFRCNPPHALQGGRQGGGAAQEAPISHVRRDSIGSGLSKGFAGGYRVTASYPQAVRRFQRK